MTDHEKPTDEWPEQDDAYERIRALKDEGNILHAVVPTGKDDTYWYYICMVERHYQGNDYLNERYVQLAKPGTDREDTFKKNGINRRASDDIGKMAVRLHLAYSVVEQHDADFENSPEMGVEDISTVWVDPNGDGPDISVVNGE